MKKYFTINFIHLIHTVCQILSAVTNQCHFTVSAIIFLTLTPNIPILFNAISQHSIISPIHCTRHTALLKTIPIHFWWDALPCHYDPQWLHTTFTFLGLSTDLNPRRFTIFSTDGVSGVQNLNIYVLDICVASVVWSVWVRGSFYGF